MNSGQLNKRIVIQTPTQTKDSEGYANSSWATFATVWAAVKPMAGRELIMAGVNAPQNSVQFTIRYLAGVLPTMRISYGGKYYNITNVANLDDGNRWIELTTSEVI